MLPASDYAEKRMQSYNNLLDSAILIRLFLPVTLFLAIFAEINEGKMKKRMITGGLLSVVLLASSCSEPYRLVGMERTRILVDSRYDAAPDAGGDEFIRPYKARVDSLMSPVVGRAAVDMGVGRPESPLSNLLADILMWASAEHGEHPAFAVYNMGGIRAAFSRGDVTCGDVLEVAPFDNKICFLTLTGKKVLELFGQMAAVGGEGVSRGVELVIADGGRLKQARLNGKPIDPEGGYRVVTLDYVAQGNDKMPAFRSKADVKVPLSEENNVRFMIMDYFRAAAARGEAVSAAVEGRIKMEE